MRAGLGPGAGEAFEAAGSATDGDSAPLPAVAGSRELAPAELRAAGPDAAAGVLVSDVGVFAPVFGCTPALVVVVPGFSAAPGAVVPEAADGVALGRATGSSTVPDCALAFAGAAGTVAGAGVLWGPVGVTDGVETAPLFGAAGVGPSGVIGRCAESSGAAGDFWALSPTGRSFPAIDSVGGGGISPTARGGGQPVITTIIATAQTVARPVSSRLLTLPSISTEGMAWARSKAGPRRRPRRVRPPRASPAADAVAVDAVDAVDTVSR